MSSIRFSDELNAELVDFSRGFVEHVLGKCDPSRLIHAKIDLSDWTRPTHIIAFGKASVAMSNAIAELLADRLAGGVVLAPESTIPEVGLPHFRYFGVDHPIPTQRNVDAALHVAEYARSIPSDHDCVVCVSGGGSAHLCLPKEGVTLCEIVEQTDRLNTSGSAIHELNMYRRSAEQLKSGGLARLLNHVHHCETVVLSDVLGNDLETIASGPLYDREQLIEHRIIGDHTTALSAAAEYLKCVDGRDPITTPMASGSSSDLGRALARAFRNDPDQLAQVIAGETTVQADAESGVGGPTLELVLSSAVELSQSPSLVNEWVVIGFATDGVDGPSQAAGAVVHPEMLTYRSTLTSALDALENHDTLPFLDSIGATFRTGPTGTNLNDVCAVCRFPPVGT
ncbi:MAG: DUF4147 domain-containing protein [Phycisphaerales bacterium]|nr:DUF4147 domain-containing protein [Phycisphaerales bacterium]